MSAEKVEGEIDIQNGVRSQWCGSHTGLMRFTDGKARGKWHQSMFTNSLSVVTSN